MAEDLVQANRVDVSTKRGPSVLHYHRGNCFSV